MLSIIIIIIKNEKIRVTLCENAAGALYIVNICMMCVNFIKYYHHLYFLIFPAFLIFKKIKNVISILFNMYLCMYLISNNYITKTQNYDYQHSPYRVFEYITEIWLNA